MALPPTTDASNDAFVREVDEEYRRDQLLTLWQKYGKIGLGVLGGALLLIAGYLIWQSRSDSIAGVHGEQLEAALKSGNVYDMRKLAAEGGEGYRAAAKFAEGDVMLAKNDVKSAAAVYGSIAADTKLPQPWRDRALVQQTAA